MRKRGAAPARETTDFVDREETSETKLVPDAAFIMENIEAPHQGPCALLWRLMRCRKDPGAAGLFQGVPLQGMGLV
jgi:hypothetical protein